MRNLDLGNMTDEELLRFLDRYDPVIRELAERLEYANDQLSVYEKITDEGRRQLDLNTKSEEKLVVPGEGLYEPSEN